MSIANLVKGCPLFYEIYPNEIENILQSCQVASYDNGDYIIRQGDTSTDICVILSGEAVVTVEKDGHEKDVATLGKGDLFGELVLINEVERTANILATANCDILVISYETFYSFYKKKPQIFALMVLNVTRLVTKRLKAANKIIQELSEGPHKNK